MLPSTLQCWRRVHRYLTSGVPGPDVFLFGGRVIVSTSALELGIDVGDLDRVIQVNSPATVAAFLQRLGRSGRRDGTVCNCLFLALEDDELLHAAGLLLAWSRGFVEPVAPPPARGACPRRAGRLRALLAGVPNLVRCENHLGSVLSGSPSPRISAIATGGSSSRN
jgi:hypothetical protein